MERPGLATMNKFFAIFNFPKNETIVVQHSYGCNMILLMKTNLPGDDFPPLITLMLGTGKVIVDASLPATS